MTTNTISLIITSDVTISAQIEAIGLTVKILVINSATGNPIPLAKVYVEGGTTTPQTTDTTGVVYWQGFKTEDINKTFVCRVADSGTETYLNYTNSFQLRGLANETWIVPLSNSNNSAKCYLLSEKTLAPVNNAAISIVDQSTTSVGIPNMVTVDGLAEWQGLTLDVGEYSFYYSNYDVLPDETPITAISEPFAANLSTVQVIRYMFINPPLDGIVPSDRIPGIVGYSNGNNPIYSEEFGFIRPNTLQLTPSMKGNISAVLLQQDQCTISVATDIESEALIDCLLTFKMQGLPDMELVYVYDTMGNYIFSGSNFMITEQWYSYWGENLGTLLPYELTSSLNVSALEIHVETSDGSHITSARVEISYNGKANVSTTDNKGISVFYGVPTGTEISYIVTAAGYNTKQGSWTIDTDVEYDTEYVVLTKTSTTYTIMMGIAIGGSASSNKSTAAEGEQVIFTASPDVGSEFLNWEILKDGESTPTISIDNSLTYTMPACNIGVTPVFNEGSPPVPSDPITLVFKVTGTDGPPSGYTVRFTYPSGSLIFQGTTSPLGTVRMNTDNYPIYAEDGMIATATNGSNTGTIIINASDVTDDKANPSGEILFEIPVNVPTGVINVPAEGETFTFTVPQNITVLEAITASQGTTVKDYIGVTAGKTYTWSVALTYTPPQPVVRGLWQLKNGSDSVLVQIVKYIGSNLVGSGASVLSYSEAINKISPTITAY